jgi:hypothetical protein
LSCTNSDEDDLFKQLPKAATTLAKLALKPSDDVDANHIAQAFISLERDKAVAKARIRASARDAGRSRKLFGLGGHDDDFSEDSCTALEGCFPA